MIEVRKAEEAHPKLRLLLKGCFEPGSKDDFGLFLDRLVAEVLRAIDEDRATLTPETRDGEGEGR